MAIPTDSWMTKENFYGTTITTTQTGNDNTVTIDPNTQLNFSTDKTPEDPFEEAELKLAGICPSCRKEDGDHDWDCKNYDYSTTSITGAGITFNSNYQPGIAINTVQDTEIALGQATLNEAKVKKLDKLLDLFDDDELDQLILDKLTKKVDKE